MPRPRIIAVTIVLGFAFLACKGKAQAPGDGAAKDPAAAQQGGLRAQGTAAFPAETRVVIGLSVPKIAASPLARKVASGLLARDPGAAQRLADLLSHCKLDPEKQIDSITIGMAEAKDLALVVRGRVDDPALVSCVRAESTAAGGTFTDKQVSGHTVYTATSKDGAQNVYFTFEPDHTVVVALSEPWLGKILDPKAAKIDAAKEMVALLGRASKDAAVWGAGFLPPGVGENLVKLTEGQVAQPAQSVAFEATFDQGLAALLRVDMKGATDAEKLAAFAKGQLEWLAVAAQRYAIGPIVSKIQIVSEQASVKFSARLDDADVKTLEAALAKGAPANPDKKEQPK